MSSLGDPTAEEKRAALDAALTSDTLARSERLKGLLRFIGEAEIEGRGAQLNEYLIGVEALGRPEGYSTSEDSSVRSRVCELRQRLDRLYGTEAQHAPVKIELRKGSHCPRFVRNGAPPPVPAAPKSAGSSKNVLLAGAAGVLAGGLAVWLVVSLTRDHTRAAAGVAWNPALQAIWAPFLDPNTPTLLTYESRLFLGSGSWTVVRDYRVNAMNMTESSAELNAVRKALALAQFTENRNYTEFGFVPAAILLTRALTARQVNFSAKRSADLTWSDIRANNLILIGKPASDAQVEHFLPQSEFVDEGARIRVLHPRPGEQPEYLEKFDPKNASNWSEKYALVSFGPGPERGRSVLCLAISGAEHPWALAVYLTNPAYAEDLVRRLRLPNGNLPPSYQVLIRARFKAQEPTEIEYVTHRVL